LFIQTIENLFNNAYDFSGDDFPSSLELQAQTQAVTGSYHVSGAVKKHL